MTQRPKLEVCLSPALLHLYDTRDTVTVIIDIYRATSTIVAALGNGATGVIPVATVEECIKIGSLSESNITAGERDGKVAEGLQHGNSPLEYPSEFISGKTLVLTTTNGTRLLHMVQNAATIITGSFLNLDAVCRFLEGQGRNVLLGCAAWKDRFNLEDTLFAGAVVEQVREHFSINCDSARAAAILHEDSKGDYLAFLKNSSHYHRLAAYGLEEDLAYCTLKNQYPIVPVLQGKKLVVHG